MRILETKNLYQQEELQRLKGINEGIRNSKDFQPQTCSTSPTACGSTKDDTRVLILENENLATKLKLIEQNFEAKLKMIKVDINNRFLCLKNNSSPQKNQKPNPSKCKDSYKIKTLTDKFDDLNNRLRICENATAKKADSPNRH